MVVIFYVNLISTLILVCVGIPGNLLILYFFLVKCWNRISSYYLFIIYLAVIDLLVCCYQSFIYITILSSSRSKLASFICKDMSLISLGISTASVWIFWGLSFDRYRKITKPFAKQLPKWFIHVLCIFVMICGHLYYVPYEGARSIDEKTSTCTMHEVPTDTIISTFVFHAVVCLACMSVIPISMILYFNVKISRQLKDQRNADFQQSETFSRNQKASSTIKWLTIVTGVSVFIPIGFLNVIYSMYLFSKDVSIVSSELLSITESLPCINSVCNVFIYWLHVKEFKDFYRESSIRSRHQFRNQRTLITELELCSNTVEETTVLRHSEF